MFRAYKHETSRIEKEKEEQRRIELKKNLKRIE